MSARILVVDDEDAIREALAQTLRGEGFDVEEADDGRQALHRALSEPFDLVLLDIILPHLGGLEICRRIRAESDVPILLLSARGSEADRVLGLEAGADDYVGKPFSLAELLSRVRAILRRRRLDLQPSLPVRRVGDMAIDLSRHRVRIGERTVDLTPAEFRLLALLAEEPGRVFSRREIIRRLWQSEYVGNERVCDAHVSNLRHKIEADPSNPERVVTVRAIGYVLRPV
jgi:DNA-binding response OmpR family regulator